MATLVAAFNASTASVLLTIDGTTWTTVPATVTATRQASGGSLEKVRGIIGKVVTGGFLAATDHEMPLDTSVAYVVTGYSAVGASVGTATATVSTAGCAPGLWLKAAGRPDLTVRVGIAAGGVGDVESDTVGGAYQVLGGGSVSVVAQYSGPGAFSQDLTMQTFGTPLCAQTRTLLANRVLLIQCTGSDDVPTGWRFVSKVSEGLLAQTLGGGGGRRWQMSTKSAVSPAGQAGGAGWTWQMLAATYPTWTATKARYASWFAAQQGA